MTKDEFAIYLTERGYPAENENGVVMISKDKPLKKTDIKAVRELMKEAGYNASYGYTYVCKNNQNYGRSTHL